MLFILGLFLGCVLGFIVACLCRVAGAKTPELFTAGSGPEVIEEAAWSAPQAAAAPCRLLIDAFDGNR